MIEVGRCKVADRLRSLDMTQQELADLTGLSRTRINDYVNNRRTMSLKSAAIVAYALRCSIDDLYEFKIVGRRD